MFATSRSQEVKSSDRETERNAALTFHAAVDQSVFLKESTPACASLVLSWFAQSWMPGIKCADAEIAGWIEAGIAPALLAIVTLLPRL